MTEPLPPRYNPAEIEADLYRFWVEHECFSPDGPAAVGAEQQLRAVGAEQQLRPYKAAEPYVVVMPPPNVTAVLHMGHGLNNTVQDVLVRFERMRGRAALWIPGTDHAGIATQNVVEKVVASEGKTRFDLGREEFVRRVWAFVTETGGVILDQLKAIGASADWSRAYFTLDEDLSRAVREAFVRLYEKGLIYRGKYIINWCPRCLTALSNEEVEKAEAEGRIWRFRYPLADGSGHITVATTRPETILGDTAVAVHPDDPRYAPLIGTLVRLPLVEREIPMVADSAVDQDFGTGAVKVTPAHDPLDFEIGQRHGLAAIDIFTPDAHLNDAVPERFRGLDRFAARKRVVAEFETLGLLDRVEHHRHAVGHCYRCETAIEPRLSDQWFVKMAPLAEPALEAYRDGRLRFIPERRGDEYANWMENIRDWTISRQLWWGHRIPVWYCDACGATIVSRTDQSTCPHCSGAVRQDEDVLDTWFSSWLVPFSSLGWPRKTEDLKRYYPGSVLATAPEILFFWVARMVMAGCEFMGEIPFHTVYLHGTVRDTQHRKMSKSLGNGIDPLEVVRQFGADALRYTMIAGMAVGTDVILDPNDLETSFAPGRNFANKIWNAGRFVFANLGDSAARRLGGSYADVIRSEELSLADRWIIARCDRMVRAATGNYEKYRLNEAASDIYHFLWSDLADWYLEQIKPRLYGTEPGGDVARAVVARSFEVALVMLHPIMPFITETLWQRFPGRPQGGSIMRAAWPKPDRRAVDDRAEAEFSLVQEVVTSVREIRAEYEVPPGKLVRVKLSRPSATSMKACQVEASTIRRLARASELEFGEAKGDIGAYATISDGTTVFVDLGAAIDVKRECERMMKERDRLDDLIQGQNKKLTNQAFLERAPKQIVESESRKKFDMIGRRNALVRKLSSLGCIDPE